MITVSSGKHDYTYHQGLLSHHVHAITFFRVRQSQVDNETTEHITGGCTILAAIDYNKLNNVARIVHEQVTFE